MSGGRTEASVSEAIDRCGWEDLLAEMVRTPSHPGVPRQESGVVAVMARWLEAHGVEVERSDAAPGRPNLTARIDCGGRGKRLLLCSHTDTVSPSEDLVTPIHARSSGPFSAEVRDGLLHGRGAADAKGPLAAMAAALVALRTSGALPGGGVTLAAVADEEMESLGAERLVRSGVEADGAIVGEPTENRLALGHRGLEWLELEFRGRASHGGTPRKGVNAILAAARFIALANERLVSGFEARAHPLVGPPTINFGMIRGGDGPSTVPAACVVTAARRSVPGESYDSIVKELRDLLDPVEAEFAGLSVEVRRAEGGMATMEHLPAMIGEDHALARAVDEACAKVRGRREPSISFPAWSDASLLSNFGQIPCIVLGPGDLALAHSAAESVPLAEVAEAARIYAAAAQEFCRP